MYEPDLNDGPSYWDFDNQKMYFHDSRFINETIDIENTVDVIVTSPPYNVGKNYISDSGNVYCDNLSWGPYCNLLSDVFKQCFRSLNKSGVFYLNVGDSAKDPTFSHKVLSIALNCGFYHLQTVIWVKSILGKGHYTPSGGTRRFNNVWENIFILVKDKKSHNLNTKLIGVPYSDKSNVGRYSKSDCKDPGNVWFMPYKKTTSKLVKKSHAAPFPLELPYKCIKAVEGARNVLDPFAGLGTSLAASRLLGKNGIGFELFPQFDAIKDCIKNSRLVDDSLLIPHLEEAVKLLAKDRHELEKIYTDFKCGYTTKNNKTKMSIMINILDKLGIDPDSLF